MWSIELPLGCSCSQGPALTAFCSFTAPLEGISATRLCHSHLFDFFLIPSSAPCQSSSQLACGHHRKEFSLLGGQSTAASVLKVNFLVAGDPTMPSLSAIFKFSFYLCRLTPSFSYVFLEAYTFKKGTA